MFFGCFYVFAGIFVVALVFGHSGLFCAVTGGLGFWVCVVLIVLGLGGFGFWGL